MLDLRGRNVRIGNFLNADGAEFKQGEKTEFRTDGFDIGCTREELQINYYDLPPVMREGDEVILGHNG
jgi:pyruvate kinase